MDQLLEKLFESVPKARILRLFLQNQESYFTFPQIVKKTQIKSKFIKRELVKFMHLGLIKKKIASIQEEKIRKIHGKRKHVTVSKKTYVYYINQDFYALSQLTELVIKSLAPSRLKLAKTIKGLGDVRFALICGALTQNNNSRTDLLIVGNKIKKPKLNGFLEKIESELGKSLHYTVMDVQEFKYRMDMFDRFLRDVLESPHEKLINRMRI